MKKSDNPSASLTANLVESATGQNVDPDPLGMRRKNAKPDTSAQDNLARIAQQLFSESDPLRRGLIQRSSDFMNGGFDITGTPQFSALKNNTDRFFGKAKQNVISSTPAGGALTDALSNLETNRAMDLSTGAGQLTENELNRAVGLATGQTPTAVSGLSSAANIQAQQYQAEQARNAQSKQGLGQGLGTLLAFIA